MKKIIYNIWLLVVIVVFSSCEKDLMSDINEGDWNNERNILDINLKQQIGLSEIVRTGDQTSIKITVNASGLDLKAIDITSMVLSYDAKANVTSGDKLDFDNPEKKSSIIVTSKKGENLQWDIYITPFINEIEGDWKISSFFIKWDDGFGWGNAGSAEVSDLIPESATGLDDIITFGQVEGANDEGLVYGNYERTKGNDNLAPSFVYSTTGVDWASKFNHLPVGTGEWLLNKDNSITITVNGKSYTTKIFQKMDASNLKIPLDPGPFDLGKLNWDNYYGDHSNKFVSTKELFYSLKKQ